MFRRFRYIVGLLVVVCFSVGCGGALSPRTSWPMPWQEWAELGALVDASRGHPIAFWADPARKPQTVEIHGATLHTSQWLTHLALRMNEAIGRKTLFDTRFQAVSPTLFKWELSAGRYRYTHAAKPAVTAAIVARSLAHVVELRFASARVVKIGSERGVRILVDVVVGGVKRSYAADSTRTSGWDAVIMDRLARRILGDPSFWTAVRSK